MTLSLLYFSNFIYPIILINIITIKVINITSDGESTINEYLKYQPDILILDLNMPNKDGIEVLETLCTLNTTEAKKCNIIVVSGKLSQYTFKYVSKIYQVFQKPFDLPAILDSIYEIYEINNNKPNCRKFCEDTFLQLGFNFTSIGTKYLIDSILYLYDNNISNFSMNDIYKEISIRNNTSFRNIKWNIEKSINSMYRFSRKEDLLEFFPYYDERKPTPKYIISMLLYKLPNKK